MCAWCQFGSTTGQSQPIQSYPKQSNWTFPRIHPGAHQPAVTMAAVCLIPLSLECRGLGTHRSLGEVHDWGRLIYGRPAPLLHCELIFHGASYAYSYARSSGRRPVTGPLPRRSFHRSVGRSVGGRMSKCVVVVVVVTTGVDTALARASMMDELLPTSRASSPSTPTTHMPSTIPRHARWGP
jgi:hypothetical protein